MSFIIVTSCISLALSIFYVLIAYCLFVYVPWKNICSYQLSSYRLGHLSFFTVNVKVFLVNFWIHVSLSITYFVNIFSHSVSCLFTLLIVFFDAQKFLIIMQSNLSVFCFLCFWCYLKKSL